MYLVLAMISMMAVIRSCQPWTLLRKTVCTVMICSFIFAFVIGGQYLHFADITMRLSIYALSITSIGILIERWIYMLIKRHHKAKVLFPFISK